MADITLHSWAHPLEIAPFLDHTWVTNFPEPNSANPPPEHYWYCWGIVHTEAREELSSGHADEALATSIQPSNTPALEPGEPNYAPSNTSGSIVYYGLDGVCHQTANQVLASTGSSEMEPVRVHGAHGYPLSTFLFSTYGLNSEGWEQIVQQLLPDVQLPGDDFIPILEAAVAPERRAKILEIRVAAQMSIILLRAAVANHGFNYYPLVGAIAAAALYKIHDYLPQSEFEDLFPSLEIGNDDWLKPPLA